MSHLVDSFDIFMIQTAKYESQTQVLWDALYDMYLLKKMIHRFVAIGYGSVYLGIVKQCILLSLSIVK